MSKRSKYVHAIQEIIKDLDSRRGYLHGQKEMIRDSSCNVIFSEKIKVYDDLISDLETIFEGFPLKMKDGDEIKDKA